MIVWTGLVFAGGEGRRMGADKAALAIGGRTLLQRAVDRVRAAGGEPIVLGPMRGHDEVCGARQIDDRVNGLPEGPLLALRRGLQALGPPGRAVALACDLPLVPAALLRHLAQVGEVWDAVVPRSAGELHVLSAAYGIECLPAIGRSIGRGERAVYPFLREVRHRILEEDALEPFGGPEIFMNVNTPADLAVIRARLAPGGP
jgi:molybdopterin-guanine dinucleotide biosynthesis protein A